MNRSSTFRIKLHLCTETVKKHNEVWDDEHRREPSTLNSATQTVGNVEIPKIVSIVAKVEKLHSFI